MSQQTPDSKIIRVPTADNPDGEFGVCWRTLGVQILIGTPQVPAGVLNVKPEPQPIPMATAAPCIGRRCTAWHEQARQCSFIVLNILQIERATEESAAELMTPYLDKILAHFEAKKPPVDLGTGKFFGSDDPNKN